MKTKNTLFNPKLLYWPEKKYIDIDLQKKIIMSDNKNKSGVYKWINTKTKGFYIGSSVNLSRRLSDYFNAEIIAKCR